MEIERARSEVAAIFASVVREVDPERLTREALRLRGDAIEVAGERLLLSPAARVVVVAIGKAAVSMARGAVGALGDRIASGVAVTKRGGPAIESIGPLRVLASSHPIPDESSVAAGRAVLTAVSNLVPDDLLIALISGGGSALVEAPVEGISVVEVAEATSTLLRAGADIQVLNAVRRRLSRIKAGGLARAAAPARLVNLIVSDVLGNPLPVIASGPTIEIDEEAIDPEEAARALGVWEELPAAVRSALGQPTMRAGTRRPAAVLTHILADAATAARAAAEAARDLGYEAVELGTDFEGEAREFGRFWAALARHVRASGEPFRPPVCLVGAGELTVTVRGDGIGGRNTEMALAAARGIAGIDGLAIASLATDGDDGVSGATGGVVVGSTLARGEAAGFDAAARLANNDSAPFLAVSGSLLVTGPTGTNVNDLYLALVP